MTKLLSFMDKLFRKDAERVVVRITEERSETVRVIDWAVVIFAVALVSGLVELTLSAFGFGF